MTTRPEFQWGPVARGLYMALIALGALIALFVTPLFLYYVLFLLFLGFGLRPLLIATGLHRFFGFLSAEVESRRWRKFDEERRREVERKQRDDRYRDKRYRDPRLPKNW